MTQESKNQQARPITALIPRVGAVAERVARKIIASQFSGHSKDFQGLSWTSRHFQAAPSISMYFRVNLLIDHLLMVNGSWLMPKARDSWLHGPRLMTHGPDKMIAGTPSLGPLTPLFSWP